MGRQIQLAPFAALFVLLVVFQGAMIAADCRQTPARVAKQFTKAFYYLDADMQNYVCDDLSRSEALGDYLHAMRKEAHERGFSTNYLRQMFTSLHVQTLKRDDASASVKVSGTTRVAINPVFMVVGKVFRLADQYHMEGTLDLIRENGAWKICGRPFGLQPEA